MAPVTGEVSLVRSHSVIELSSYVKPPDVQTGSVMISLLGGDRSHVVVWHLRCLARLRRAGRPAAAALAAVGNSSLQNISLCLRCSSRFCHNRRSSRRPLPAAARDLTHVPQMPPLPAARPAARAATPSARSWLGLGLGLGWVRVRPWGLGLRSGQACLRPLDFSSARRL